MEFPQQAHHPDRSSAAYSPVPLAEPDNFGHQNIMYTGELQPPQPFVQVNRSSAYSSGAGSFTPSTPAPLIPAHEKENNYIQPAPGVYGKRPKKRMWTWIIVIIILLLIAVAVVVPIYFTLIKPKSNKTLASNTSGSSSTSTTGSPQATQTNPGTNSNLVQTTGRDGSTIVMDTGESFVYSNKFDGVWVSDPADPYSNNAQANSWTPPLNTSWKWGVDRVKGVNIGGLFVLEPFISPALFQAYPGAVDEWSISTMMAASPDGMQPLEDHYRNFITEQDIAMIAGAGLNWIRLQIPYWALETWSAETAPGPSEPFLAKTCWPYILRLIGWARKYGLRIKIDLHTIPGSQNGLNHSGKLGQINFLLGPMGLANAQRTIGYIRSFVEFFSQPEYQEIIGIFGIVNEPSIKDISLDVISSFYTEVYNTIRSITGTGEGKGPYMAIGDGFFGLNTWAGYMEGADRMMMDYHPYMAFDEGQTGTDPIDTGTGTDAGGDWPLKACTRWSASVNQSRSQFGVTVAGEWSNGFNDCALYLRGTQTTAKNWPGSCDLYLDASQWTDGLKAGLKQFNMAQMDSFGDWFFWTWKIGNSTAGHVQAPLWSYKLGLEMGFIPADPRDADGLCGKLGVTGKPFSGTYSAWQTGGAGAGTLASTAPWPPPSINADVQSSAASVLPLASLPTYTSTGPALTLPVQTFTYTTSADGSLKTETKAGNGNGWFNAQDNGGAAATVSGCAAASGYLDPWNAVGSSLPTTVCGASAQITTPPRQ